MYCSWKTPVLTGPKNTFLYTISGYSMITSRTRFLGNALPLLHNPGLKSTCHRREPFISYSATVLLYENTNTSIDCNANLWWVSKHTCAFHVAFIQWSSSFHPKSHLWALPVRIGFKPPPAKWRVVSLYLSHIISSLGSYNIKAWINNYNSSKIENKTATSL